MSDERRVSVAATPSSGDAESSCAHLYVDEKYVRHLCPEHLLALADDLAAILDTDGYVPRHARAAS